MSLENKKTNFLQIIAFGILSPKTPPSRNQEDLFSFSWLGDRTQNLTENVFVTL